MWIHVTSERTLDLRLFAPESDNRLAIRFRVGDGSPRDVHAGAGLDPGVIARYVDKKTGELQYVEDDALRLRTTMAEIHCELKPLDDSIGHWPVYTERFKFGPGHLEGRGTLIVIPNVTPGRWRLTLTGFYEALFSCHETLLTRDFTFSRGSGPMWGLPPVRRSPAAVKCSPLCNACGGGKYPASLGVWDAHRPWDEPNTCG